MAFEPFLSSFQADYELPSSQNISNAAIIVIFAFLVPLLTMEINYFRLAIYKSWRHRVTLERRREFNKQRQTIAHNSDAELAENHGESVLVTGVVADDTSTGRSIIRSSSSNSSGTEDISHRGSSASGSASNSPEITSCLSLTFTSINHDANNTALQTAYRNIRYASMQAILSSLLIYAVTAAGIALHTRGMDQKVIAIIMGASKFMASLMAFIFSAMIPQWIGVYHHRAIHLIKWSSSYSQHVENIDIHDEDHLSNLRTNVRLGVWFHFAKFYVILMPFYCGVQASTIPISIIIGAGSGFLLMWCVFVVHEKYIHHQNAVAFATIFILCVASTLAFARGMAWMQAVWNLNIFENDDVLILISFFAWLGVLAFVHTLLIIHTLRMEEKREGGLSKEHVDVKEQTATSAHASRLNAAHKKRDSARMRRNGTSYNSFFSPIRTHPREQRKSTDLTQMGANCSPFIFDPRTHFRDVKEQEYLEPDLTFSSEEALPMDDGVPMVGRNSVDTGASVTAETTHIALSDGTNTMRFSSDANLASHVEVVDTLLSSNNDRNKTKSTITLDASPQETPTKRPPAWCEVFICVTPEYKESTLLWKIICWLKVFIIVLANCLCLYFVIVCIGATKQITSTRQKLPSVREALYTHMNEGPVCAFDNRGPESNITTFENKEAAHDAGFLVVHCGACGACSSWENLILEYTTRDSMAALANECAKKSMFGGNDALLDCIMDDTTIGFAEECAICWMEDIVCTKDNCAFIFLQAQMINNVGNFAVGENDITSASCEEAHCEVGKFVPCSGATRRRMNIISSISRPGEQQCSIVDVESWEDLFFGSGIA